MASKVTVGLAVMALVICSRAAVVEAQKPTDVIESADSEWSGVRTELVEVKRMSDNTIRVRWRWRNTTNKPISIHVRVEIEDTYLLDPVNKKKHLVVTDVKGHVIGSHIGDILGNEEIAANQAIMVWVRFPAPPASVGKVSVVIARTPPFEDVAISK